MRLIQRRYQKESSTKVHYIFCKKSGCRLPLQICDSRCKRKCNDFYKKEIYMRIQETVYKGCYETEKTKDKFTRLFLDFKFAYESFCPLSWVDEVYAITKAETDKYPEIEHLRVDEVDRKLIFEYDIDRRKGGSVEKIVNSTRQQLVEKGVMLEEALNV